MKLIQITEAEINNGPGFRTTVWFSGCPHHCYGCHNPETWSENSGKDFIYGRDDETIYRSLRDPNIDGITLTGGEPIKINNDEDLSLVAKIVYNTKEVYNKSVWIYTGYVWEDLIKIDNAILRFILSNTDVLVDGPFMKDLRDVSIPFRGSSNQRLIDVQKSLQSNEVILYGVHRLF